MSATSRPPPKGRLVLLLHGWPYDVHNYAEFAPRLGSAGYRVIVPYLRGFGPTLFRSIDTIRNRQRSALGLDAIALMDALDVRHAIIGIDGFVQTRSKPSVLARAIIAAPTARPSCRPAATSLGYSTPAMSRE